MSLIKCPECGHEISDQAESCPNCGCPLIKKQKKASGSSSTFLGGLARWLALVPIIVIALAAFWTGSQKNSKTISLQQAPRESKTVGVVPLAGNDTIDKNKYIHDSIFLFEKRSIESPRSILMMNFKIINIGKVAVKDISIKCDVFAKSGTLIDSNENTIYQTIRPEEERVFSEFNMGFVHPQGEDVLCSITNFKF